MLLALTFATRSAGAADTPDIRVTIDENFGATAVATKPVNCFGNEFKEGQTIAYSPYKRHTYVSSIIRGILDESRVCTRTDRTTPKANVVIADKAKTLYFPDAASPRTGEIEFSDELWGARVLQELGEMSNKCTETGRKDGSNSEETFAECKVSRHGNKLTFTVPSGLRTGTAQVSFKSKNATRTLNVDLYLCQFQALGELRSLVRGASLQRVELAPAAKQSACENVWQPISHLQLGTAVIPLSEAPVTQLSDGLTFDVRGVPMDLPLGLREFELYGNNGAIGVVSMEVLEAIKVAPRLQVDYRPQLVPGETSDFNSYFDLANGASDEGVAVVNPLRSAEETRWVVANTAALSLPDGLPIASEQTFKQVPRIPKPAYGNDKLFESRSMDNQYRWVVLDHPIDHEVFVDGCRWFFDDHDDGMTRDWCMLDKAPASLKFSVASPTKRPLRARLGLVKVITESGVLHTFGTGDEQPKDEDLDLRSYEIVLQVDVTLANEARRESVPLPISDLLEINCEENKASSSRKPKSKVDIAYDGETQAIENEAMRAGQCRLQIRPACLPPNDGKVCPEGKVRNGAECIDKGDPRSCPQAERLNQVAALFGPQTLLVTVKREGVDEAVKVWPLRFDDGGQNTFVVLPVPSGDNDAKGLYTVNVRIAAEPNGDALYRGASKNKLLADLTNREHSDLRFTARLRPRGPTGWKCLPIRTYLTGSVAVTGFRTPAAVNELRHSGQSSAVQYVTPRAGLLFSVEPFNDDRGENPLALDPTFQIGMNLVQFNEPDFAPTFVTGIAATVPVLEGAPSQIGSKVAAGLYFEYEPRYRSPHLLLTLGLNIGSLFSGNTK